MLQTTRHVRSILVQQTLHCTAWGSCTSQTSWLLSKWFSRGNYIVTISLSRWLVILSRIPECLYVCSSYLPRQGFCACSAPQCGVWSGDVQGCVLGTLWLRVSIQRLDIKILHIRKKKMAVSMTEACREQSIADTAEPHPVLIPPWLEYRLIIGVWTPAVMLRVEVKVERKESILGAFSPGN